MGEEATVQGTHEDLASVLEVLAQPVRLALVHRLARPAFVPELVGEFGITRQALKKHLDALVAAGLVTGRAARRGALPATQYAASPAGLFAFKEGVLALAVHGDPALRVPTSTMPSHAAPAVAGHSAGAGLLLVHGESPGRWFPLGAKDSWVLGRDGGADVAIPYDPFASARHALLRRGPSGWTLTDMRSTNGTRVNFRPIAPGEAVAVRPGDLLTVGRSHLLLRDGM